MSTIFPLADSSNFITAAISTCLLAQQGAPLSGGNLVDAVQQMSHGKLTILLIFGAALVSAVGYALAGIIRAYHAAPDESEELSARLDDVEKRLDLLEKARDRANVS